ncbi:MAG: DUF3530 family protein [Pseudomonadota bacterium]
MRSPRFPARSLLLALLLSAPWFAFAEDTHPLEQRLRDGEGIWLEADGARFFAIARQAARPNPRGGVLLVGGRGEHPDYPGVMSPVRRELADQGWLTLALARDPDGATDGRLRAGTDWLMDRLEDDSPRIVLLGHGLGGLDLLNALDDTGTTPHALVLVDVVIPSGDDGEQALERLTNAEFPILDIYRRGAPRSVVDTASERRRNARRGDNAHYRQDALPGSGRTTTEARALTRRIQGWLGDPRQERRERKEWKASNPDPATRTERRETTRDSEAGGTEDDLRRYFSPPAGD